MMEACQGNRHLRPVHLNRGRKAHIWICLACGKDSKGGTVEKAYLEEIQGLLKLEKPAAPPSPAAEAPTPEVPKEKKMPEYRRCKGCNKPLMFVQGENGKIIPLDREAPVFEITKDLTGAEVAKRVGSTIMVSHFATCPKANDFSKGRRA